MRQRAYNKLFEQIMIEEAAADPLTQRIVQCLATMTINDVAPEAHDAVYVADYYGLTPEGMNTAICIAMQRHSALEAQDSC